MYQVKKMPLRNTNMVPADIIPISSIRQTCQLIPCFGAGVVPEEWRSGNVLDSCDRPTIASHRWKNEFRNSLYSHQSC
jgi:hypothetical protein